VLLENFCDDGNGGVNWVGDHENEGFRGSGGNCGCQAFDDASVDLMGNEKDGRNRKRDPYLEEIITIYQPHSVYTSCRADESTLPSHLRGS